MSRARDLADLAGSADAGGLTGRNMLINGAFNVHSSGTSATVTSGSVPLTVHRFSTTALIFSMAMFNRKSGHNSPIGARVC